MPATSEPSWNERRAARVPTELVWLDRRYLVTDLIHRDAGRVWKVRELVAELEGAGFDLGANPSKTVSGVLRTEIRRGRVVRVGWGAYRAGTIPESTRRRIRSRVQVRRAALDHR